MDDSSSTKELFRSLFGKKGRVQDQHSQSPAPFTPPLATTSRVTTSSPVPPTNSASTVSKHKNDASKLQKRDLWAEAFNGLPEGQRDVLQPRGGDDKREPPNSAEAVVETVIEYTKNEYRDYCSRGWHTQKGNKSRETNVRLKAKDVLCAALQFKDLVDAGLKLDPTRYGKIVWGVVGGALQLLQNDKDRVEAVFDSAAVMARLLPKYAVVEAYYRDWKTDRQNDFEDRIVDVYAAILNYAGEAKKGLGISKAGRLGSSFWSADNQNIKAFKDEVVKTDREASDMMQHRAHQYRRKEFNELNDKAENTLQQVEVAVREIQEIRKIAVLNWLFDAEPSNRQHLLYNEMERTNRGSGKWFLVSSEFSRWQSQQNTFLWLSGVSGCGKSSLCSVIIHHLATGFTKDNDRVLAYWYFDNRDPATQDIRKLLRFILRRVAASTDKFPKSIDELAKEKELPNSDLDVKALCAVLKKTLAELDEKIYIIFDAIDEYPADGNNTLRKELLDVISELVEANLDKLHLLVTSTRERDIYAAFKRLAEAPVEIDIEKPVIVDLDAYLDKNIEELATSKNWNENTKAEISRALGNNNQKRFRITALQLQDLRKCYDEKEIEAALNGIPHTLERLYEQKLGQVESKDVPRVRNIFHCLSSMIRPLSINEIAAAPGVELPNSEDVLNICPNSFVNFSEEQQGGQSVRLVEFQHASVRRFLMSEKLQGSKHTVVPDFFITPIEGQVKITRACLSYLLRMKQTHLSRESLQENSFLSYSAEYWHDHLKIVEASKEASPADKDGILSLVLELFKSPLTPSFLNWMRIANPESRTMELGLSEYGCPSPLYMALFLKLHRVAQLLVEKGTDVNERGGELGTALQLSVKNGNSTMVKQLLDRGAKVDPDGEDDQDKSALFIAASQGDPEIVESLLLAGARTDKPVGKFGNVLQLASYRGFTKVVQHLLRFNTDVNARGGIFGNPLQAAAAGGHLEIVGLLLEGGADANVCSGLLGNAIQAALAGQYSKIVEKLIAGGARLESKGDICWHEALTRSRIDGSNPEGMLQVLMDNSKALRKIQREDFPIEIWRKETPKRQEHLAAVRRANDERLVKPETLRLPKDKKSRKDEQILQELRALVPQVYDSGNEGMDRAFYLPKALFWVAASSIIPSYVETYPSDYSLVELLVTILRKKKDQTMLETTETKAYDDAREQLVELRLFSSQQIRMATSMADFRAQNQKFEAAMTTARLVALPKELESGVLGRVEQVLATEVRESELRLGIKLEAVERNLMAFMREALPRIVRDEVKRQIGVLLEEEGDVDGGESEEGSSGDV